MGDNVQESSIRNSKVMSNMILLLLGRLVSLFGTRIYSFAISLYVLKTTGSGTSFALSLVFGTLPGVVFGPIAGVLSDKINRKKMVVWMDILSGAVVLILSALAIVDDLRLTYIYIASFLLATCNTFFNIPFQTSIPNIVDEKNLMRTNSLNQTVTSITSIAGPFLGGIIFTLVDIKFFLVVNGITFILSGISEMFIDFNLNKTIVKEAPKEVKEKKINVKSIVKDFMHDFIEGFTYLKSVRSMFILIMSAMFLNLFVTLGLTVPLPYIANEIIKMSETQFGTLQAVFPLGMLLSSIALSIIPQSEKNFKKIILGLLIIDIGIILMGAMIIPSSLIFSINVYFISYMVIGFFISIGTVIINVPFAVTLQKVIPDNIRGRVFSLDNMLSTLCTPIGMLLSGIFIDLIPVWILPVASGIILLGITIVMAYNKDIREL